jgi:hypothetical protein
MLLCHINYIFLVKFMVKVRPKNRERLTQMEGLGSMLLAEWLQIF